MDTGQWTWLEVAKLTGNVLTPMALAAMGVYVHRITKRFEHVQWRSQKLIEKRLAIYDRLAPLLNDVLCYFSYVGTWKLQDPQEIISLKRTIDKEMHLAAPLFSTEFFQACMEFQGACYETYNGWGEDPLLRTAMIRRKDARRHDWNNDWDRCFSSNWSEPDTVRAAYCRVMNAFARDIGVHPEFVVPPSGRGPSNIL